MSNADNYEAYKTLLEYVVMPSAPALPAEVHFSNAFAAWLIGADQLAFLPVDAEGYRLYKGLKFKVFSMPVDLHIYYGDYTL